MTARAGPNLTAEQVAALDVRGASVALGAGAGCGKTTVLAERFVRALEGPGASPLGRVVALTFTNKAARELKGRIRRECRDRLASGGDPALWRGVLRGLEAARIGTIHSFCGEVLRGHAIDAGVDPGFAVLDPSIEQAIRDSALDTSIREGLAARDADLIDLAVEYGLRGVRQALDDLLDARAAGDLRDWLDREPIDLVAHWHAAWVDRVRPSLLRRFADAAGPCLDFLRSTDIDSDKVRDHLALLIDAFGRFGGPGDPDDALVEIRELAKVNKLAAKHWPSPACHERVKADFERIRKAVDKLRPILVVDEHATLLAARQGLGFARLAEAGRQAYDRAKRARGAVDNDDLLIRTRDLLARSGPVASKLAEGIDLLLVDEFQDTDPVQASILEALAGPGVLGGRLFLVGDFKQSIYRFRGARPELFLGYRERFPAQGRLDLTANFRSVPAILDFVNACFASTFPGPGSALVAGGQPDREPGPPAVAFAWGEPPAAGRDLGPEGKPDAEARRRAEARPAGPPPRRPAPRRVDDPRPRHRPPPPGDERRRGDPVPVALGLAGV